MIGLRSDDRRVRRFWAWFASEAHGYANALEALMRGEADASVLFDQLNARLRLVDVTLRGDVARTLDGDCVLHLEGGESALAHLLRHAPALRGWRILESAPDRDTRRAPYRVTPRPALDFLAAPIAGVHEAWA